MNIIECLNNLIDDIRIKSSNLKERELYDFDRVNDFDDIEDNFKYKEYIFTHKELLKDKQKEIIKDFKDHMKSDKGIYVLNYSMYDIALMVMIDLANIDIESYNKAIVDIKNMYRKTGISISVLLTEKTI